MNNVYLYLMMVLAVVNIVVGILATRHLYKALPFLFPDADRREALLCVKRPTARRVPENYFSDQGVLHARAGMKIAKLQRFAFMGAIAFLILAVFQR